MSISCCSRFLCSASLCFSALLSALRSRIYTISLAFFFVSSIFFQAYSNTTVKQPFRVQLPFVPPVSKELYGLRAASRLLKPAYEKLSGLQARQTTLHCKCPVECRGRRCPNHVSLWRIVGHSPTHSQDCPLIGS